MRNLLIGRCCLLALASHVLGRESSCKASKFSGIDVDGLKVLDVTATAQKGFTQWMSLFTALDVAPGTAIDFCNVTVTLTHPGQNDNVHVYVWLPLDDQKWNGRFLGEGGGGWHAGIDTSLGLGVSQGYAAANTDAGHSLFDGFPGILTSSSWAYLSKGNTDWNLLQNMAARSIGDLPKVAKQVIKSFYGKPAKKAYWQGCSTGGRQGMISAQRFPENYDGILSIAPAQNWAKFLVAEHWPHLVMRQEKYFPSQCEFAAIRAAAIEACDQLDGVKDGIIAAHTLCEYDASDAVGKPYTCGKVTGKISKEAARVANRIWTGPQRNGKNEWFGVLRDMPFGGDGPIAGLANTVCDEEGENCQSAHFPISEDWIKIHLAKDKDYDVNTMTEEDFWKFFDQSRREYTSILSSDWPNLSEYKAAGGKMIQWHGLSDQLIFPGGSANYFERVEGMDNKVRDFYRYFEVPGVLHCTGGAGAFPFHALDALVDWVEKGVAPDTLVGTIPASAGALVGQERIFCPYPRVAAYKGGDSAKKESYECAESFDKFKSQWMTHSEL